jgi:hypothetical protein
MLQCSLQPMRHCGGRRGCGGRAVHGRNRFNALLKDWAEHGTVVAAISTAGGGGAADAKSRFALQSLHAPVAEDFVHGFQRLAGNRLLRFCNAWPKKQRS